MTRRSQEWLPPFTREHVLAIINEKSFKTDTRIDANCEELDTLVGQLNTWSRLHTSSVGEWERQRQLVTAIKSAIDFLAQNIPELIEIESRFKEHVIFDENLALAEGCTPPNPSGERLYMLRSETKLGRAEAQALIGIHNATLIAKHLGIPRFFHIGTDQYQKWEGLTKSLVREFDAIFPGRKKASVYRFLEQVIPFITQETPTFEAIQTYFKRNRPISKRRRQKMPPTR